MAPRPLTSTRDDQEAAAEASRRPTLPPVEALVAGLFLLFAVAFSLYHLYPEVAIPAPVLNDGVLHRLALERARTVLAAGQDPTDPWLAPIVLGYPLFHHYQHLPYLVPALLCLPFGETLESADLLNWTQLLLLCLFPLTIYAAMRRFGFGLLPAAFGGLVAPLLSTDGLYGFDLASYVWRGYGLYTQLWGMVLLPLALAWGYTALRTGRGAVWAGLLLAATALSHLVYGFIALVSLALLAFLPVLGRRAVSPAPDGLWRRARRLVLLLALVALLTSYFLVPYLMDRAFMNRSVWEEAGKYDAYGYEWTLGALMRGDLFDFDRFPSLTLLAGAGLLACLWRWREERYRLPLVLSIAWLLLYFGRPTWGVLLDLLPFSGDLHVHRLIGGVHLGGILLIGTGLALPWQWSLSSPSEGERSKVGVPWPWPVLVAAVLTAVLLVPVYRERGAYLAQNAGWMAESRQALAAEQADLAALVEVLRAAPPGRVYAGLGGNWGKDYQVGQVPVYALLQGEGLDMLGYLYHALSLNADIQVLFDETRAEQYNLFNVRYVVAPAEQAFPKFVQLLATFGRHRLYQATTSSYFDVVGSEVAFTGNKHEFYPAAAHWLASDLPRVEEHPALLLSGAVADYERTFSLSQATEVISLAHFPAEPPRGQILSQTLGSQVYQAEVEVKRDSFLLLKVTYHPGWRATVDGVPVDTVMLMPSYIGVKLAPGTHHVHLDYQPPVWRGLLAIAGLLSLPLIALAERRRQALRAWLVHLIPGRLLSPVHGAAAAIAAWPPFAAARARVRPSLPYLATLLVFTLLAGLPLFQFKIMSGHDALEYLPRMAEFYAGLQAGQWFPRWVPDLSAGYGQPFFSFNPPLFYYLSALLHVIGFGLIAAQNLACFLLLLLAGLGMFRLGSEFFGRRGGLVAAVAYLFAPYLLVTLYVRHALADFTAFAFLPWAFWGLTRFTRDGRPRSLLLGAVSLMLLLLSSNPVALISFPALLLFLVWQAGRERSRRALLWGIGCLVLGLGLAAFFWLPALVERGYVHLERLLEDYLHYSQHFVYPHQFLHSPWGYGLSLPGPQDGMSFALGPVQLLLAAAAVWGLWRLRRMGERAQMAIGFFLLLLLLSAFLASTAAASVWQWLPLLHYLEFPWRFLSLAALSSALLCGIPFLLIPPHRSRLATGVMVVLIAGLFLFGFPHARPEVLLDIDAADYSPEAIRERGLAVTTAEEYEPLWVEERPVAQAAAPVTLVAGEARLLSSWLSPTRLEIQADVTQAARLQVNSFYFPGWTVAVDGRAWPAAPSQPQGLIEFTLEPGTHQVEVWFADTPLRRWSMVLSLGALGLLLLIGVGSGLRLVRCRRAGPEYGPVKPTCGKF